MFLDKVVAALGPGIQKVLPCPFLARLDSCPTAMELLETGQRSPGNVLVLLLASSRAEVARADLQDHAVLRGHDQGAGREVSRGAALESTARSRIHGTTMTTSANGKGWQGTSS